MESIFYDLKPTYSQWKVAFIGHGEEELSNFFKALSERNIAEIDRPIPISTYNIIKNQNEWKDKCPFHNDVLEWKDDIILGSSTLHGITSIIISERLKLLLESFKLPRHKFYEVNLTNIHTKESRKWFLLYMPDDPMGFIDWELCEFKLTPKFKYRKKIKTSYVGPQIVSSREDFVKLRSKYRKEEVKMFLDFYKVVYKVNYDVMWGNLNKLVIGEKLKEEIESNEIKVSVNLKG